MLELIRAEKAGADDYEELLQLMDANTEPWFVKHLQDYFSANPIHVPDHYPKSTSPAWRSVLRKVLDTDRPTQEGKTPVIPMRTWLRAVAILVVVLTGGFFYFQLRDKKEEVANANPQPAPINPSIAPGKDGAVLTLADGSTVVLDSLGDGFVTAQGGSKVMLENGQLAYEPAGNAKAGVLWNSIETPKGRQFKLTLQDGTKVWLNAATILRYPTSFDSGERKVQLTGEAYFEVTKNNAQPFRVVIGDTATVEVLGTDFNINSYTDEPAVRTTLLKGSVRLKNSQHTMVLQPGQQAIMQKDITIDKNANIDGAVAWKSGKFNFEGASLEEFLRQLARWYDIDIEYTGPTRKMMISGKLGRDLDLEELLEALGQDLRIQYKVENRKLIIQ